LRNINVTETFSFPLNLILQVETAAKNLPVDGKCPFSPIKNNKFSFSLKKVNKSIFLELTTFCFGGYIVN
jgi:hypothetical protein